MQEIVLNQDPKGWKHYLKAVKAKDKPNADKLPGITIIKKEVTIDKAHLAAYQSVCKFQKSDELSATYLHILVHTLYMELLTQEDFPFALLGLVHLKNTITYYEKVTSKDKLDFHVYFGEMGTHSKGKVIPIITKIYCKEKLVWEETAENLKRVSSGESGEKVKTKIEDDVLTGGSEIWKLPSDLGRAYAKVSGDYNPIHLYAITAKMFGFQRHIIHGMWTKARALASLEKYIQDKPYRITAEFKLPLFLPGTVRFTYNTKNNDKEIPYEVRDARSLKPHVKGKVEFL
jgi:acyl dehydratase